jgi:heme-degrading monooxygenase HmoA
VIVRIWRTCIDPARADEYERFAAERSLPMFRAQEGYRGVLFTTAGDDTRAVVSFWEDAAALEALDRSESYRETVDALVATGLLGGEQSVELLEVHGGEPPSR